MMYVQDYDGSYPKAYMYPAVDMGELGYNYGSWYVLLAPYVKNGQIYRCPSLAQNGTSSPYQIAALGIMYSELGYGWNIGTPPGDHGSVHADGWYQNGFGYYWNDGVPIRNESTVEAPADTVLLGDISVYSGNYRYLIWHPSIDYIPDPHNEGANYAFADGHAKWLSRSAVHGQPELFVVDKP